MPKPLFVWIDRHGLGRHVNAYFRREFKLAALPAKALLHIFADSNYHLKVNGAFVGYGPARFHPRQPEYDTWNIARLLRRGANVIAVQVVAHGMATFMTALNRGGFIAWGAIPNGSSAAIDLATPGAWLCRQATGYEQNAPLFSFTSNAIDIFDARQGVPDWDRSRIPRQGWRKPVVLEEQNSWGQLRPRSIPHLTQAEKVPEKLLAAYPLLADEEIISFRVAKPWDANTREAMSARKRVFACTWLQSPRRQKVRAGLFWGEYYLNGKKVKKAETRPDQVNRNDAVLALRQGWNFFFISYDMCESTWEFHMALPRAAGLQLSAERKTEASPAFLTAGPFAADEEDQVRKLKIPFASPHDLPPLSQTWIRQPRQTLPVNPAVHLAWSHFGQAYDTPGTKVAKLVARDPHGTAYVFDFGHNTLGRIFVEFEAPAGTIIDVGFGEWLHRDRPDILRRCMIYAGERHIARGGRGRFETFKPRGFRYLQINICRNRGPARLHRVGVIEQVYPFKKIGTFACSDPLFDDIWEMGWRTLRLCAEDSYTDCPWRERHLYAGDMLPEFATTLATSGDTRLARRCLRLLAPRSGNDKDNRHVGMELGDFPLISLLILDWYLRCTRELKLAQELYPAYRALVNTYLAKREADGLFSCQRAFIDWIAMVKEGKLCAMHALLAESCSALARIASLLGHGGEARRLRREHRTLGRLVCQRFWNIAAGAFSDAIQNGRRINSHFPVSSAWPSLWGMTTPQQEKALARFFATTLADIRGNKNEALCSAYSGFYILGALYRHGQEGIAEEFIRRHWGAILHAGADTAWEIFPDAEKGEDGLTRYLPRAGWSLCHAWSTAPTFYLSSRALGVPLGFPEIISPTAPLVIAPQSATLSWARGTVPTPQGPLNIDWQIAGQSLIVSVEAPRGLRWTVAPRGRLTKMDLWTNGKRAAASRQ